MTHTNSHQMFGNRLAKNARHRRKWARRRDITCYRLYDRDIPEVPMVVDWYEGHAVVSHFPAHDDEETEDWLRPMLDEVRERLDPDQLHYKVRRRQRGAEQYGRVDYKNIPIVVGEGGHRFWVNLTDYLDTGLFLDHRQTRAMVAAESDGARVLNLFSYTGSFSVYAAAAGAARVVSLDMSKTYTAWAAENFAINDIDPERHPIICADVFEWLETGSGVFDIVVIDPPIFSNSKKMSRSFDVQRDHLELIERVLPRVLPGGRIYFSTPRRKLALDTAGLEALGFEVTEITSQTVPEDFRQRRPHRAFRLDRR